MVSSVGRGRLASSLLRMTDPSQARNADFRVDSSLDSSVNRNIDGGIVVGSCDQEEFSKTAFALYTQTYWYSCSNGGKGRVKEEDQIAGS